MASSPPPPVELPFAFSPEPPADSLDAAGEPRFPSSLPTPQPSTRTNCRDGSGPFPRASGVDDVSALASRAERGHQQHEGHQQQHPQQRGGKNHTYGNLHPSHFYVPPLHDGEGSSTDARGRDGDTAVAGGRTPASPAPLPSAADTETVDFSDTFVTVCESDAEAEGNSDEEGNRGGASHGGSTCGGDKNGGDFYGRATGGSGGPHGAGSCEDGKGGMWYDCRGGDVLAALLSGPAGTTTSKEPGAEGSAAASCGDNEGDQRNREGRVGDKGEALVVKCEAANEASHKATSAMKRGDAASALQARGEAARLFRDAALSVKDVDPSLANSLLLLSKTQARSGVALKRILKKGGGLPVTGTGSKENSSEQAKETVSTSSESSAVSSAATAATVPLPSGGGGGGLGSSPHERLRATVRRSLGSTRNEADITDSAFLGTATSKGRDVVGPATASLLASAAVPPTNESGGGGAGSNPVDDMMKLERELRDMDMALELGGSIASLGARTHSRTKTSPLEEGSFCVVPPGSLYMSSSIWAGAPAGAGRTHHDGRAGAAAAVPATAGARARANRLQTATTMATPLKSATAHHQQLAAAQHQQHQQQHQQQQVAHKHGGNNPGLESSWWGHASVASHLASSITSAGSGRGGAGGGHHDSPANTKQLMRLLDSLKTLGDENSALLREVEDAQAARAEAKAAKERMSQFKAEYGKRFATLRAALEKFRKDYPAHKGDVGKNPVIGSDYVKSTAESEVRKREETIQKLAAELKKEREESKKKDAALRKYENFYREVKARSAQKAAQRQKEQMKERNQHQQRSKIDPPRSQR